MMQIILTRRPLKSDNETESKQIPGAGGLVVALTNLFRLVQYLFSGVVGQNHRLLVVLRLSSEEVGNLGRRFGSIIGGIIG
jgi:hypothetical protein